MELENIPSKTEEQSEIEKEMMEVTEENKSECEIVARETNETPQVHKIPTWDEFPEWAKKLQVGELIPFNGSFFKLIGMTPDFALVLKYEGQTGKSKE